mgnify:FL=1
MTALARSLVAAALALALVSHAPVAAQEEEGQAARVEDIRASPRSHVGELRVIEGVVDRLVSRGASERPGFYLEDDFGHQLLVVPFDEPPARGERVRVTGVVSVDAAGDPLLTVFDAAGIVRPGLDAPEVGGGAPETPAAPPPQSPEPRPGDSPSGTSPWLFFFLAAGALFIAIVAYRRGRASAEPDLITGEPSRRTKEPDIATSALWPESEREFDGRTMRFVRPDPTVRLMPAKLEVIGGGDTGEEIRFVAVANEPVEVMFGRAPGEGPRNVHLKQKTVSRTHAIVRYRHGEWMIENLSMTNPTVLNGEILGVKERLLTDGDRIEMGEVVFRFVE